VDSFSVQLRVLSERLDKKKAALAQIISITENQENILLSPYAESDGGALFFNGLNDEKHKLIEFVLEADNLFQNLFDSIKEEFEDKAREYKDEIQALKDNIKEVVDMDVKIRIREEKNRMLIEKTKPKQKLPVSGASKAYLIKQYQKNKTN